MSYNYNGKVVIVTGSSSGIGEDAIINFAKCGAQVVIADRNGPGAAIVAEKCKNASPFKLEPLVIVADVTNDEDCKKIIQETIGKFQRIDVLVNSAGIGIQSNLSKENLLTAYERTFATNVRSVLVLTQLVAPHLEKNKGVIINIASTSSVLGSTSIMTYCMSKAAVDSLTKCAAMELGPKGIRVVAIK